MRVLRAIIGLAVVSLLWTSGPATAQNLIANRFFVGSATLSITRPGYSQSAQTVNVDATFSGNGAGIGITLPGGDPLQCSYGFLELPQGPTSIALMIRKGGANGLFPSMILALGQARPEGNSMIGIGWLSGIDALGTYNGFLLLQLQQPLILLPPVPDPEPPVPTPGPAPAHLPSFDGTTLRVPAEWEVRKFEGWALQLARKYGTLSGGTSATVPVAWQDGVMQCHGAQGFVYQIPLTMNYEGHMNGFILYTRDGTWPHWEPRERWHAIAGASGHTKYVFR